MFSLLYISITTTSTLSPRKLSPNTVDQLDKAFKCLLAHGFSFKATKVTHFKVTILVQFHSSHNVVFSRSQ